MTIPLTDFAPLATEMFVLSMACIILVAEAFFGQQLRQLSYVLSQLTLLVAALISWNMLDMDTVVVLGGTFVHDPMAAVLKTSIFLMVRLVHSCMRAATRRARAASVGEYYVLGLFAVLGMMVMISAHSLLTIYLGLELLSLSLYAMVAFDRDSSPASEAAMKYFVLGALASGMLLYGMSMLYGATGSLDIKEIAADICAGWGGRSMILIFALCFIGVGHRLQVRRGAFSYVGAGCLSWCADRRDPVYRQRPETSGICHGDAPAGGVDGPPRCAGLAGDAGDSWRCCHWLWAMLSPLRRPNLKRMLAYSTISHVGFLLLGILAGTKEGYSASMFYTITYALMAIGAFGMIILMSRKGYEADQLDDFKGLNERSPVVCLHDADPDVFHDRCTANSSVSLPSCRYCRP